MFYDLPRDVQNSITKCLNMKDFIGAKKIYDDHHRQLETLNQKSSHMEEC